MKGKIIEDVLDYAVCLVGYIHIGSYNVIVGVDRYNCNSHKLPVKKNTMQWTYYYYKIESIHVEV